MTKAERDKLRQYLEHFATGVPELRRFELGWLLDAADRADRLQKLLFCAATWIPVKRGTAKLRSDIDAAFAELGATR